MNAKFTENIGNPISKSNTESKIKIPILLDKEEKKIIIYFKWHNDMKRHVEKSIARSKKKISKQ